MYFRHSPLEAGTAVSHFLPTRLALKPNPTFYKNSLRLFRIVLGHKVPRHSLLVCPETM